MGTTGLPGPRESAGISKGSRKVCLENIEKLRCMGDPGLGDLAEEPQELRERVRHTGGGGTHFSGVPVRMILGLTRQASCPGKAAMKGRGQKCRQETSC